MEPWHKAYFRCFRVVYMPISCSQVWGEGDTLLAWVQGMREQRPSLGGSMPWMELLYRRTVGDLLNIPAAPKTKKAEESLSLQRSVYYYVGRCNPDFGELVVAHTDRSHAAPREIEVTPFDTGGLALGHIQTLRPMDADGRRNLVRDHTYTWDGYVAPIDSWLGTAFASSEDYIRGVPPRQPAVADVPIDRDEDRTWTWEGRVEARDYGGPPIRPAKIIVKTGHQNLYIEWMRKARVLNMDASLEHIRWFRSVVEEVVDPVERMRAYLSDDS